MRRFLRVCAGLGSVSRLGSPERDFYVSSWDRIQATFVDDPTGSVTQADQLVGVAMSASGYPVADFDQRSADISVDHPTVVEHYRAAHAIAARNARGTATTEELRQAMIDYRILFDTLVGIPETVHTKMAS